jgi:hypothetical protein
MGGVTIAGAQTAFFAYLDRRDDFETQMNVYAVDAPAGALDFTGRERRVDTDAVGADSNYLGQGGLMASDGASSFYVAIYLRSEGAGTELWVTRSSDGGRTYHPIRKVSLSASSSGEVHDPKVRAFPDGRVYVSWQRWDAATGLTFLMFRRSTDFGGTWGPEIVLAGPLTQIQSHILVANASAVLSIWSDGAEISVRRSIDGGLTFSPPADLDANPNSFSTWPIACTQGNRIVFVYEGYDGPGGGNSPWARVSLDSGATWGPRQSISSPGGITSTYMSIACDAGTTAVAVWLDDSTGPLRAYASRLSGGAWFPQLSLGGPAGDQWFTDVTWAGGTNFVAAVGTWTDTEVYTSRSTNGGAGWSAPVRHDDQAPQPLAFSTDPRVASDGAGNVWLSWWEMSAGQPSIAARHSGDFGATFGPVRRADRALPQGASWNYSSHGLFAHPGVGFLAWIGRRTTSYGDIRIQTWDTADLDRDGSGDAADCNDESAIIYPGAPEACDGIANDCNAPGWPAVPANEIDPDADGIMNCAGDNCPAVFNPTQSNLDGDTLGDACDADRDGDGVDNALDCAPDDPGAAVGPPEVAGVQASRSGATFSLAWAAVPGAAAYDVARGTVAQLRASGNTGSASGQSCSQTATTYSDTKQIPADTTWYFIVRGRVGACHGTWGANTAGVPRTTAACP